MGEVRDRVIRNLKRYVKESGIEQKEIASRLGMSPSAVTSWMSGRNTPDIEVLWELCKIFGVTLGEMVGEENEKPAAVSGGGEEDVQLKEIIQQSTQNQKKRLVAVAKILLSEDAERKE